jgi:hypothetical protein
MRRLAIAALLLLAGAAPASADRPPRFAAIDLRVDRHAHAVHLTTVVEDDAAQVLEKRYRTTLRYRCTGGWHVAVRTGETTASVELAWRYRRRVGGKTCSFRVTVARRGGASTTSKSFRRRL